MCLCQRLAHNLGGDAFDLDVHLQGGDALGGSGDFEVHVAEVIFSTLDIGQDDVAVAFFDQTHGNTGNRCFDGNTGIHQCQGGTADGCHRGGTVGGQYF